MMDLVIRNGLSFEDILMVAYRRALRERRGAEDVPLYYDIAAHLLDILDEYLIKSVYCDSLGIQISKGELYSDFLLQEMLDRNGFEYIDYNGNHLNDCQNTLIPGWI